MKRLLFLLLVSLISLQACGDKKETATEKEQKSKSESEENTEAASDPETEKSKEELASKEEANLDQSSGSKENDLGMTPGLPADFPEDVPKPKNSKTLGSLNSTEGTVVTFESNDKVTEIIEFYKEQMKSNGYEIVEGSENLVSDKGGVLSWKKNNKEIGLMLGYDKDKNITSLVITYK